MTVDEFREALGAMSFTGGLGMWKPRVTIEATAYTVNLSRRHPDATHLSVRFIVDVPHREDNGLIDVGVLRTVALRDLNEWDLTRAMQWVRAQLLELVTHELDEGLLVAGVRVFDPHSIEERTSAFARAGHRLEDRQRQATSCAMSVDVQPRWSQAELEAMFAPFPLRSGRDYREEALAFVGLDLAGP